MDNSGKLFGGISKKNPYALFIGEVTPTKKPTRKPPVKTTDSDCGLARTDLIIVIDSSTSVTEQNFKKIRTFVRELISKADIDSGNVQVGVVTYSTDVRQEFQLNTYNNKRRMLAAIDRIRYNYGSTNTAGALNVMRTKMFTPPNGDRPDVHNVAIVLTDGISNINSQDTIPEGQLAYDEGIHIYAIGIGLTDFRELDGIAAKPAYRNSFKVNDFDELKNLDEQIFAAVCPKQYTVPPTTTTTTTPPTRRTRPPTTRRPTTTTTRRTTTPRRIPQESDTGVDLIFMLDSSVNNQIFDWMKTFITDFANSLNVDSGEWQIGAMTFDNRARYEFHLNRYNFKDEVVNGIGKMRTYSSSRRPDTGAAFDYVRQRMFTRRTGDRPLARNYVVLLTGNERSLSSRKTYDAATRLKDLGTGVYTVGLNFRDSTELDEISSRPVDDHRMMVYNLEELGEIPGIFRYRMENAPPPTTRPTTTTTTTTTTTVPPTPYRGDCKSRGDVVFILDSSGSVGDYNFDRVRNFTMATVRDLEVDNGFFRIAVVSFSDSAQIEFYLNTYNKKQDVMDAIRRVPYIYGYTHTAQALRRVRTEVFVETNGDRPDVPNMVVIVTDGQSNVNHFETLPEADRIKSSGTTILTVAIGLSNNAELQGMTSPPVDLNLIEVTDFEGLHRLGHTIVAPLCTDGNLCTNKPCQNEGVCVDGLRSYMCICQPGFYGSNCEKRCGPKADVVFVLDSSTSVGSNNFRAIKSYAQRLVHDMNVVTCDIHVGVLKYSSAPMIQFNLGAYDDADSIARAIEDISYTRGRSNMADALRVMRTEMFNNINGDRYDARNIAYLLTDGSVEIKRDMTFPEAELVIDAGVRLIPLAVAVRDRREIEMIAEVQGMQLYEIESETNLIEMSDQVLEAVHDGSDYCSNNPCLNGGVCENRPLGFSCKCKEGFTGDICDKECNGKADVIFVMDLSRYNSREELRHIKRFVRDVVKRMAFRQRNYRVAVVEYGKSPRLRLGLSEGDNKKTVKSVVSNLRRASGDPDLNRAIRLVSSNIVGTSGDRSDVPNYVVLVTRTVGGPATVESLNKLKSRGTRVIGVGVQMADSDRMYMEAAVSQPVSTTLFMTSSIEDLQDFSRDFVSFVCEQKNLCLGNPCENGGTCQNGGSEYTCQCAPGFAGKNCERSCSDRADVVFLLDSSGSVGFDNFRRMKEFMHHIVENFNIGPDSTQVGVATFSSNSRNEFFLKQYSEKRQLQAAISGLTYEYGNTNTASGLKLVRTALFSHARGNRPDVPDFLIVVTDGLSNVNADATIPEAELLKAQGVHVIAIGVGVSDTWELNAIATKPTDTNVFVLSDWAELFGISDQLIDRTCRDTSVCSDSPCRNGGTCIAGVGTFTCQCIAGYLGEFCELNCENEKDIAIILDSSTSVGPDNFQHMLSYVMVLIKDLTANGAKHRFSFITYSTAVKTIFRFDRYGDVGQILDVVKTTRYTPGSTNTAGGLRQAHQMFQPGFGERRTAANIAILITDGQSNINFYDTIPAATDLKDSGVKVIGIGIGLTNTNEINAIATSQKDVFQVTNFTELKELEDDIVEGSCAAVEAPRRERGEVEG